MVCQDNFIVTYLLDDLLILYREESYRSLLENNALTKLVFYTSFQITILLPVTNVVDNLLRVAGHPWSSVDKICEIIRNDKCDRYRKRLIVAASYWQSNKQFNSNDSIRKLFTIADKMAYSL